MNLSKFSKSSLGLDCNTMHTGCTSSSQCDRLLSRSRKNYSERELKLSELLLGSVPQRRNSPVPCRIIELNRRTYGAASHLNIVHEFMVQISRQVLLAGRSAEIGYGY